MSTQTLTIGKALNLGLRQAMEDDAKVVLMGEDIGKLGGVFRITDGLQKDFGDDRVIDTPLAESGIIGTAVGLAMRGYRPVCEIQFDGFVFPAYDQIVTQVAKMHARSQGQAADADRHPHPVRRRHRRGRAPQRVPRGLLRAHRRAEGRRRQQPGRRVLGHPAGDRLRRPDRLPRAQAAVLGEGRGRHRRDAGAAVRAPASSAAATTSPCWPTARWCGRPAGREAAAEEGRSLEVIDLRTLSPLDLDPVFESVRRTGRCVVVHEAP